MVQDNINTAKSELFKKPSAATAGIKGTIKRRQEAFARQKAQERRKNIQKAEKYIERIQKGDITNINDVPRDVRKYIDLGDFFKENKKKLKNKLEEAENKEEQAEKKYEKKLESLREWYSEQEKTESTKKAYEEQKRDYEESLKAEAEYYEELSNTLKENLDKLEKGEILDAKSVIDFAEKSAEASERRVEQKVESERLKQFKKEFTVEEGGKTKLKEGVKREDLPTQFKQFVDVREGEQKGFTPQQKEKIRAWMKKNKMTPSIEKTREIIKQPKVEVKEEVSREDAYDLLGIDKEEIEKNVVDKAIQGRREEIAEAKKNIQQETERYKELGYPESKAQVLARESIQRGGITFTPEAATDVLLKDIAKKQNKRIVDKLKNLSSDFLNIFARKVVPIKSDVRNVLRKVQNPDKSYGQNYENTRKLLKDVSQVMGSIRQRASQELSENEIQTLEKQISDIQGALEEGDEFYRVSLGRFKKASEDELNRLKKELKETRQKVTSGIPTKSGAIKTAVADIGADVVFPPKVVVDVADILGQVLPSKEQLGKAGKQIEKEGWEGLKKVSKDAWENVKNFFSNKDQREEVKSTIDEINEEQQKARGLIEEGKVKNPEEVRDYIQELESQKENANQILENMETNKLLNLGTAAAAVIGTSAGLFRRLRGKKIPTSTYEDIFQRKSQAENFAKNLNNEIQPYKIDEGPFLDVRIGSDELNYLNKNILKDSVDLNNIKDVKVRYSSSRIPGKAYVKKFKEKVAPGIKVDRYGIRHRPDSYANKVDVLINLKDGKRKAFSVTSKGRTPIFRFKSLKNSLKYGTNKRIDFIKEADKMLTGVRTRPRKVRGREETRLTPEDYFIGRQLGKEAKRGEQGRIRETRTGVKRRPGVADERKLTAEEYWKYGEPVSTQTVSRIEKPIEKTYFGGIGDVSRFQRKISFGTTKNITNDLKLDTSYLTYQLGKHIEEVRKLPKSKLDISKLTKQEKANLVNRIYNENIKPSDLSKPRYSSKLTVIDKAMDTAKAIDEGKGNVLLKSDNAKKLTDQDFMDIQSAISSKAIPEVKYDSLKRKNSKIVDDSSKKIKNIEKKISNSLNQVSSIRNRLGFGFASPQKSVVENSIKKLQDIKQDLSKSIEELNAQSSKLKNVETSINKNTTEVTNETQLRNLQDIRNKASNLRDTITTQYSRIQNTIGNIRQTINDYRPRREPTPARIPTPKLPESKKRIKKKRKESDFFGYNVYMKPVNKNSWKRVNEFPMSYSNAQDLGAFKADKTLQASFRVRKGSAPSRKPAEKFPKGYFMDNFNDFRNYEKRKGKKIKTPGNWIEKADKRLNSEGEINSIQKSRKKSTKKTTRKKTNRRRSKSADEYWLS